MLAVDRAGLPLAISNLVQVVKMRTSAGFIPSFSTGTHKTRDRSNPPVTSRVLLEIAKKYGLGRTDQQHHKGGKGGTDGK